MLTHTATQRDTETNTDSRDNPSEHYDDHEEHDNHDHWDDHKETPKDHQETAKILLPGNQWKQPCTHVLVRFRDTSPQRRLAKLSVCRADTLTGTLYSSCQNPSVYRTRWTKRRQSHTHIHARALTQQDRGSKRGSEGGRTGRTSALHSTKFLRRLMFADRPTVTNSVN